MTDPHQQQHPHQPPAPWTGQSQYPAHGGYPAYGQHPPQHQYPPQNQYPPQHQYPAQPWPQQYPAGPQQWGGPQSDGYGEPRFSMQLTEHTGALIFWSQRRITVVGNLGECDAAFRRTQTHCLLVGWWSLLSILLMNWIAIFGNQSAIRSVRRQAAALGVTSGRS